MRFFKITSKDVLVKSAIYLILICTVSLASSILQSPKVYGKFGLKGDFKTGTHKIYSSDIDTSYYFGNHLSSYSSNQFFHGYFKVGIENRVELLFVIIPILMPTFNGNIKVNIIDKGEYLFFRNISMAVFFGGDINSSEWSSKGSGWAGLSLGTSHYFNKHELELFMMLSGSFTSISIEPDHYVDKDITYTSIQLGLGLTYRPVNVNFMELNIGFLGQIETSKSYDATIVNTDVISSKYSHSKIDPISFHFGFSFYLPRDVKSK